MSRRGIFMLAGAATVALAYGCQEPEVPVDFEGSCPVLVECAEELDALSAADLRASFGEDGGCWEAGPNFWPQCRASCVAGLESINEVALTTGRSCGICTTDADCTGFSLPGDPGYCLDGWCARRHFAEGVDGGGEDGDGDGDTDSEGSADLDGGEDEGEAIDVCSEPELAAACTASDTPQVRLTTNFGDIVVELDRVAAPEASELFSAYVSAGFYDNTIIHRVVPDLLVQGGVYGPGPVLISPVETCSLGDAPDLSHVDGAIALVVSEGRIGPQWFITDGAQPQLDGDAGSIVFGRVVEGSSVRDAILEVPTTTLSWMGNFTLEQYPTQEVLIEAVACE